MPTFKLPRGYSFDSPASVQSIGVPDRGYGGADISQAFDATGVHYVACNAWGPGEPSFRWRAFKRVGAKYVEVALPFLATGRGEQDVQWYDGKSWAIAWTGDQFDFNVIPSFVPFPSIPSLDARIAALEAESVAALREYVAGLEARLAALASHTGDIEAVMHETQNETARVKAFAEGIAGGALTDLEGLRIVRA